MMLGLARSRVQTQRWASDSDGEMTGERTGVNDIEGDVDRGLAMHRDGGKTSKSRKDGVGRRLCMLLGQFFVVGYERELSINVWAKIQGSPGPTWILLWHAQICVMQMV